MKIRNALTIFGVLGTFTLAIFAGSAFAANGPDQVSQGQKLLAVYAKSNQQLADCMHGKGLDYDGGLVKSDVVDAFQVASNDDLNAQGRAAVAALTKTTPADRNDAVLKALPVTKQDAWIGAVNDCSAQQERAAAGGVDRTAKLAEVQRAAAASPEVQAALRTYVSCMKGSGFTVPNDPFSAPQAVMNAEHGNSAAASAMLSSYDTAWRGCVAPYQRTYDQKLFG